MYEYILNTFESLGAYQALVFVPMYMLGTLRFVPIGLLNLAAGVLFGVPLGFILVSIATVVTEAIEFEAGRHLTRGWILKKIASNKKIQAVYDMVGEGGWKAVILVRLSAILPFSVVNYTLGLSKIRFGHYLAASWIGMMPGILVSVFLGAFVGRIVFEGDRQKSTAELILLVVGAIATFVITIYASVAVKKAFDTEGPGVSQVKPLNRQVRSACCGPVSIQR